MKANICKLFALYFKVIIYGNFGHRWYDHNFEKVRLGENGPFLGL